MRNAAPAALSADRAVTEARASLSATAVLLNPALTADTVTECNVRLAAEAIGVTRLQLVNLCPVPTRDLPGLSRAAAMADAWGAGRPAIARALAESQLLVFAYGLGGLVGPARQHFQGQVRWLHDTAFAAGHRAALMLDGRPRHPSRWRQYLGPQRGLFTQPTFEERLLAALGAVPLHVRHD